MTSKPSVSCLCVSKPDRWGLLQRAILNFTEQTYADKELVVVVDQATDFAGTVQAFVDERVHADNVHVLSRQARSQIDGLVQAAVFASGAVLTLWDDDNLNHPGRLEYQVAAQARFPQGVTVLAWGMYYFYGDAQLMVVSEGKPHVPAGQRYLPSTIMAFRRFFPVMDGSVRSKPAEQMLNVTARAGRKVVPLAGNPFMHCVGVTHDNLRGYENHRRMAQERAWDATRVSRDRDSIETALTAYRWDGPIQIDGPDAGGFEFAATDRRWPDGLYPVQVEPATPPVAEKTEAQ